MSDSIKHTYILIFLTIILIIFSGSIDYQNPSYSNMDFNKYIEMAKASPGISQDVIKPFVYRIGAPWIAGLLPFAIPTNFLLLNSIALIALILSFYFFLIEFSVEKELAFLVSAIFLLNKYFFIFLTWNHFQLSDTISLSMLFYTFILVKREKIIGLLIVMLTGLIIKEYLLMIIPFGLIYYYLQNLRREFIYFGIISLISVFIFFIVRVLIVSEGGESLFTQYSSQLIHYSSPDLLIKRFIIPFTPFGLLPFFFLKDLFNFFKSNLPLFIYLISVIVLSFFGEPERLIEPAAPIHYLFIAILIEKYLKIPLSRSKTNILLTVLLLLSFTASFYHLWGIILLPTETFSVTITVISTIVVTIIFVMFKKKSHNNEVFDQPNLEQ